MLQNAPPFLSINELITGLRIIKLVFSKKPNDFNQLLR